jgi:hypothetical protein
VATNRRPIRHAAVRRIPPEALDLFRQLRAERGKDAWWRLNARLHAVLKLRPWQFPAAVRPRREAYDAADADAQERWRELAAADRAGRGKRTNRPGADNGPKSRKV